ncbi:MAG: hypothetical protein A2845_04760 [Candidatus Lloydbacteria bacterium RIFCSPHIGHO2_01_FULL_49_22]|uniref:Cohesin domain-containing protein n=1 Tax=Candidatus Lloydbacteria bacterium RIFCSPHIGHO2_01_FULL_49_22 TaxID=1798658 RepID=A0A1G2CY76_9BACT|nr:MAG: hypothetical protein A2845_04760 [Candidatus Lloydbacteria bacterium RIFCSPHIGHO2_01_FULL_49_22]OGZ10123.1 MAG: hypothetical protein A3C14_00795 [Candidatus Lloydbacteria bacterium RIFCSPHIGHO2_02_FULL_50_18]
MEIIKHHFIRHFRWYGVLVIFPVGLVSGFLAVAGMSGDAAPVTVYFSPSQETIASGTIFAVEMRLSSERSINAVGVSIDYPPEILEVLKVEKSESLLNLWIEEPEYTNQPGRLSFSGGVSEKGGFHGEGALVSVIFRANQPGVAHVAVIGAQVLAHDGKGTALTTELGKGRYTIGTMGRIPSDLNEDGKVAMSDVAKFAEHWGTPYDAFYDLNGNGKVDLNDLLLLIFVLARGGHPLW